MHAEMDNLSPQKAPGVSPQTNVIKEELISIKLKKKLFILFDNNILGRNIRTKTEDVAHSLLHDVWSILQLGSLAMQGVKSLVTLGHMEHRLLGRCSQASMASQGNKVPVLQLSRFKVELESN